MFAVQQQTAKSYALSSALPEEGGIMTKWSPSCCQIAQLGATCPLCQLQADSKEATNPLFCLLSSNSLHWTKYYIYTYVLAVPEAHITYHQVNHTIINIK